jgi:hypothetical protein
MLKICEADAVMFFIQMENFLLFKVARMSDKMNVMFQVLSKFRDKLGLSALQTMLIFYLGKDLELSSKTFYILIKVKKNFYF